MQLDAVPVVYGFGRAHRSVFPVTPAEWSRIRGFFEPQPQTAQAERHALRPAIATFERIAGRHTPLCNDQPENGRNGLGGQADCIDESTNTTTYLLVLQQHGLLRFHTVEPPAFRTRALINPHNTAVVQEGNTGTQYAVDSWYLPNGHLPDISPLQGWFRQQGPWRPAAENPPVPGFGALSPGVDAVKGV